MPLLVANMIICYNTVENRANKDNKQYQAFFEEYQKNPDEIDEYMVEYLKKAEEISKLEQEAMMNGDNNFVAPKLPNKYAPEGMSDYNLYSTVQYHKTTGENYAAKINSILDKSREQLHIYDLKGIDKNSFIYVYQLAVIDKYTKLLNTEFVFEYPHGYREFFSYRWVNPFIFIAVLFVCIFVFVREQRDGTAPIIRATKNGRINTAVAKLLAINAISFVVVLLFTLTTLLAVYLRIGLSSPNKVMQVFYELCPFGITAWQGILVYTLLKALVVCLFTTIVVCISVFFKNYIPVLASGVVVYGISYLITLIPESNLDSRIHILNLLNAANPVTLFERLRMYEFFGGAITQESLLICIYIPAILIFAVLCTAGYCKGRVIAFSFIKKLPKPKFLAKKSIKLSFDTHSILLAEFLKLINWKSISVLIIASYMVISNTAVRFQPITNIVDGLYKEYMERVEGEWTQEKSDYIREESMRLNQLIGSYEDMLQKYQNKQISTDEINDYLNNYYSAPAYNKALSMVMERENYIIENEYEPYFIYDTGWQKYLLTDYNIYITALIIMFASISFGNEHTSGFVNILRSTKKGRQKTFISKYVVVIMCSFIISLFLAVLQLSTAVSNLQLPLWNAPITSISQFSLLPSDISLSGFIFIRFATTIISYVLLALITTSISQLLKNATFAAILSGAIFILPRYLLFAGYAYVNMLDGTRIYIKSADVNLWGIWWIYLLIYTFMVLVIMLLLIYKANDKYCTTNRIRSTKV